MVLQRDADAHVGRGGLGVVHADAPVPALVEDAGVHEFELRILPRPRGTGPHQIAVREPALWIVVAPPHPGVGGGGVDVPPVLLDVLAMVAFGPVEPEDALLHDLVFAIPQAQAETERLPFVADAG